MIETLMVEGEGNTYSDAKWAMHANAKRVLGDETVVALTEDGHPRSKCWRLDSCDAEACFGRKVRITGYFSFRLPIATRDPGEIEHTQ